MTSVTATTEPVVVEKKLYRVPNQTPEEYILRHGNRLAMWIGNPICRIEWATGGILQEWIVKQPLNKCHRFSGMVRGDGKILGTVEDDGVRDCISLDQFATVDKDGRLHGVASDMYKYD